jgi:hypothetical protein
MLPSLFYSNQFCRYCYTANEGPVSIQYKCLVTIYVFPELKLLGLIISKTELLCFVSEFPQSCICERFIYPQDRCAYLTNRQAEPGK